MPGPMPVTIELSPLQLHELQVLAHGDDTRLSQRARIVLLAAEGLSNAEIARREGVQDLAARMWRGRYAEAGAAGLHDAQRRGRPTAAIVLSADERDELQRYVRRATISQHLAVRARIVLLCADGLLNKEVAALVGVGANTVGIWRKRFAERRLNGIVDLDRPGGPRKFNDEVVEQLIVRTLEEQPKGATHWSTRKAAKTPLGEASTSMSPSTVGRVWRALGLKPHRTEKHQLSTDPHFIDKVRDVVGLYMNPPDNALVLCTDEKSQIQALNRTQPMLPLRRGQVERHTPEYQRNGTITLFAALDVATGNVITKCFARHRAIEFRKFLDEIRRNTPEDLDIHLIVDNYSTHSAPTVKRWLAKNPRFHIHFIPTHSSWLNQVETWFSILTTQAIKRGSHHSVDELVATIEAFVEAWKAEAHPFKWTKTADRILENVARSCYRTLEAADIPVDTSTEES
ncbi:MAG: IS630 family transposase [Myxococcales bacterium]|nr:IS630 family transposase [Myxococcales bacterium]